MAKGKRKRGKRRQAPEVTVRFSNEGRMAKRRTTGGKRRRGNPTKHRRRGRRNPSNPPRRRRRNPKEGFGDRLMKLGGGAIVALASGAIVLVGMSKLAPSYPNVAEYGVPAAGLVLGAAVYKTHPTLGAGLALGSVAAPFSLPLASKVMTATAGTTTPAAATTAAGIGRAIRMAQLGAVQQRGLGAVQMGRAYRMYG